MGLWPVGMALRLWPVRMALRLWLIGMEWAFGPAKRHYGKKYNLCDSECLT
jgi:hypothetical protein